MAPCPGRPTLLSQCEDALAPAEHALAELEAAHARLLGEARLGSQDPHSLLPFLERHPVLGSHLHRLRLALHGPPSPAHLPRFLPHAVHPRGVRA
jgi:hypothetical protein